MSGGGFDQFANAELASALGMSAEELAALEQAKQAQDAALRASLAASSAPIAVKTEPSDVAMRSEPSAWQHQQQPQSVNNQQQAMQVQSGESKSESLANDDDGAKRKRRSRWGVEPPAPAAVAEPLKEGEKPKKRSRWATDDERVNIAPDIAGLPPQMVSIPPGLSADDKFNFILKLKMDYINKKVLELQLNPNFIDLRKPEDRSPSPEPIYDERGKRLNTRPMRLRDKLLAARGRAIDAALALKPDLNIAQFGIQKKDLKKTSKVFIPQDKHPDYNFIGLIIGPRGNTQKRLEKETNCKISIRGKGSQKAGKTSAKPQPGDDEPLHVWIVGDTQVDVDNATEIVTKLLVPVDDQHNSHKALQLRELAIINGTVRDEIVCRVCGAKGHRIFECPERTGATWQAAKVLCDICGASTHPTQDCPQGKGQGVVVPGAAENIHKEYENFMAELTGERPKTDYTLLMIAAPSADGSSASAQSSSTDAASGAAAAAAAAPGGQDTSSSGAASSAPNNNQIAGGVAGASTGADNASSASAAPAASGTPSAANSSAPAAPSRFPPPPFFGGMPPPPGFFPPPPGMYGSGMPPHMPGYFPPAGAAWGPVAPQPSAQSTSAPGTAEESKQDQPSEEGPRPPALPPPPPPSHRAPPASGQVLLPWAGAPTLTQPIAPASMGPMPPFMPPPPASQWPPMPPAGMPPFMPPGMPPFFPPPPFFGAPPPPR